MKKANAVMTVLALVFVSLPAMAGVEFDSSINYYQGGGYQSVEVRRLGRFAYQLPIVFRRSPGRAGP